MSLNRLLLLLVLLLPRPGIRRLCLSIWPETTPSIGPVDSIINKQLSVSEFPLLLLAYCVIDDGLELAFFIHIGFYHVIGNIVIDIFKGSALVLQDVMFVN